MFEGILEKRREGRLKKHLKKGNLEEHETVYMTGSFKDRQRFSADLNNKFMHEAKESAEKEGSK